MGVVGSHMLVSQTNARSSLNSSALSLTKPNRWFEPHCDRERQFAGDGGECATRLDESHHLAFVIAGPPRHDDLAAVRQRGDAWCKRRRLPKIERIDGLHV